VDKRAIENAERWLESQRHPGLPEGCAEIDEGEINQLIDSLKLETMLANAAYKILSELGLSKTKTDKVLSIMKMNQVFDEAARKMAEAIGKIGV